MSKLEQIKNSTKFTKEKKDYLINTIAELKAENERLKENQSNMCVEYYINQLKEKDEEIEKYKQYFYGFACDNFEEFQDLISGCMLLAGDEPRVFKELKKQLRENTKQVCEKIRGKLDKMKSSLWLKSGDPHSSGEYLIRLGSVYRIIDQFERGGFKDEEI